MADLSPQAQAVLDAVREICPAPADEIAAAALRAAANQLKDHYPSDQLSTFEKPQSQLLAFATELEGNYD
jgi:hypothetical protein